MFSFFSSLDFVPLSLAPAVLAVTPAPPPEALGAVVELDSVVDVSCEGAAFFGFEGLQEFFEDLRLLFASLLDRLPEQAIALLRKAVEKKKDIRLAYVDMRAAFTQQKQYKDAIAALDQAVALDPGHPDAHYRLGRLYQAMGDEIRSKKEFARVRELHQKAESLASKMPIAPTPLPQ